MTLFHRRVGGLCVAGILFALILSPATGFAAEKAKAEKKAEASQARVAAQPATDPSDNLPSPELTLGARAGDGVNEGFGDILAPILALESGIVFINPRATVSDHSAEEYNLGLGYRHLLRDKGMIIGGNVYYDRRDTERGSHFNQVGFGVEYLSDWVDARANYYLPENHTETIDHEMTTVSESTSHYTKWDDPYARGNTIYQEGVAYEAVTTTELTQHFIQYEEAMEGFDLELGVRLPIPTVMDYADVKVFGGFYHYNRDFGLDDLNGFKGRLEIKAMPSLYLDAEVFDSKDLTGNDYYLGARMSVPFDVANISKGRNPFEGAVNGMKIQKQKTTIASRLTEMVIRDLHVQTEYSEATEEMSKRTATSTIQVVSTQKVSDTLATDIVFVNQDTGNDSNPGTIEAPVQQVGTGISRGSNVFVMATVDPYYLNLTIDKNLNLMGQGFPIGHDGKYLNGDSRYAALQGNDGEATIFVDGPAGANDVKIRGFNVQNFIDAPEEIFLVPDGVTRDYGLTDVMVDSVQNFELAYNRLGDAVIGLSTLQGDLPTFNMSVHDNIFDHLGLGAGVLVGDSQGSLVFNNNTIQNTAIGLVAAGIGFDPSDQTVLNALVTDNHVTGGGLAMIADVLSDTDMRFKAISPLRVMPDLFTGMIKPLTTQELPEDLPSLSALNVAAVNIGDQGSITVNAIFSGNKIEDNILGIGALGMGSNVSLNLSVQNNQLIGGGLGALRSEPAFSGVAPEETLDGSGIGIWMLGLDGATMNNAVIANNSIASHALGIGVLGLGAARMNNGLIANNTISDSLLGIVVAGIGANPLGLVLSEEPVVHMNNWTITGNRISGNGVGQMAGELPPIISTSIIPEIANQALQETAIPDMGLAGILVAGVAPDITTFDINTGNPVVYTTEMNGYQITGNVIENEFLGIGVAGLGSDYGAPFKSIFDAKALEMNDYTIAGNAVQNNLLGILVAGIDYADMEDYEIAQNTLNGNAVGITALSAYGSDLSGLWVHNNTIIGGGLDDADLLNLPLPDTGAIGVLALDYDADMYDISIDHNVIDNHLAGVIVAGMDYADMDGIAIDQNTINHSVLGIGVVSALDEVEISDGRIQNNVINDPVIGIMALTMDNAWMDNWVISGNQVNRSLIGIMAASSDGSDMTNLVVSGNTISGANDPTKVALMTSFMDDAGLLGDIEDVLDMEWDTSAFPNSGLVGIVVSAEHAGEMGTRMEGNRLSNEAVAAEVNLEDQPSAMPITYVNNTSSDGQFHVNGTNYVLTQSGNVPSPVIETP